MISNRRTPPGSTSPKRDRDGDDRSKPFGKDRAAFEAAMQPALDRHGIDLICLGGFMRLFTAEFVQRWYGRMLNIHPSLVLFSGLDPHGQALSAGVKISGATVHFVIPETDAGPILMQGAVAVCDGDTPEALAARILEVEHRIYPEALRLLASDKVRLQGDVCKTAGSAGWPTGALISPRRELARWCSEICSVGSCTMAKVAVVGCGAMGSVYAALDGRCRSRGSCRHAFAG